MLPEDDRIDIIDGLYAEGTVYFPAAVMLIDTYKKSVLHFPSSKNFEDIPTVRRFIPAENAAGHGNMQGHAFALA